MQWVFIQIRNYCFLLLFSKIGNVTLRFMRDAHCNLNLYGSPLISPLLFLQTPRTMNRSIRCFISKKLFYATHYTVAICSQTNGSHFDRNILGQILHWRISSASLFDNPFHFYPLCNALDNVQYPDSDRVFWANFALIKPSWWNTIPCIRVLALQRCQW